MNTAEHYASIAQSYDPAFFGADYQRWELDHIVSHLRLQQTDQVVDLGAGTGVFASELYREAALSKPIFAVEPSQPMLAQAKTLSAVIPYCTDALSFTAEPEIRYDKVLMNGMIHHIPKEDLPLLYQQIYHQLSHSGIALTITRPYVVSYPFFEAAHKVWTDNHLPLEAFINAMELAGFAVSCHAYDYPVEIKKTEWFSLIRNHFWSTFSHFNHAEIEEGILEIDRQYMGDTLHFADTLLFLEAVK